MLTGPRTPDLARSGGALLRGILLRCFVLSEEPVESTEERCDGDEFLVCSDDFGALAVRAETRENFLQIGVALRVFCLTEASPDLSARRSHGEDVVPEAPPTPFLDRGGADERRRLSASVRHDEICHRKETVSLEERMLLIRGHVRQLRHCEPIPFRVGGVVKGVQKFL